MAACLSESNQTLPMDALETRHTGPWSFKCVRKKTKKKKKKNQVTSATWSCNSPQSNRKRHVVSPWWESKATRAMLIQQLATFKFSTASSYRVPRRLALGTAAATATTLLLAAFAEAL